MNPKLHLVRAILCSLATLLLAMSAQAQFRAAVQGTVFDPNNAGVVGATVTLTNSETNKSQQTTTSSEGFYRFTELPPGTYTLTAEMTGFKRQSLESVVVNAEQTLGVNIQLELGVATETVTITDQVSQQIETENANIDRNVSTMEIQRLPQFGRDPYELTRLTPGVFGDFARGGSGTAVNLPNQSGPGGSNRAIFQTENQPQISANGQRVSANSYQIDGTSVNSLTWGGAAVVTPNQESVREVQVIANNYSAEYGRNSGAQVLTVSQSGTNDFHGSLFIKNNSPGLNAFNKYGGPGPNGTSLPGVRNNQHYNQFGGSLGGPIPIPRFGERTGPDFKLAKNKAFFFFSYEGLRSNSTSVFTELVETPQYRQLIQQVRPGSIAARILGSPGIEPRIISVIPVPCNFFSGFNNTNCRQVAGGLDLGSPAGATGQYLSFGNLQGGGFDGIPDVEYAQMAAPQTSRGNQFNPRIDLNLTTRDTITFSSYISQFKGLSSDPGGRSRPMADINTAPRNLFGTLTYVRTISPTTINEARVNGTRFAFNELNSSTGTNWGIPRIEIETYPRDRIRFGPPWAETTPGIFAQNTYEFRDTLRNSHGNHGLSFGVDINWEQNNNNLLGGSRPLYTFAGLFNFANDAPLFYQIRANPQTGGPAIAQRYFRSKIYSLFAQDDWKIRPNLTLNLGLRWEYFTPLSEAQGHLSNLVLGQGTAGLTGASLVVTKSLYPPDRNNFAPRIGFAWSPKNFAGVHTENNLVIRGGFGIAYNRIPTVVFANAFGNPPFFERANICCGTSASDFSTPFNGGQILYALGANNSPSSYPANPALVLTFNPTTGVPNVTNGGIQLEVWGAPAKVPTPYVYTYSLEGQYALPAKLTATLGYQGSTGRKLLRLVNEQFFFPNPSWVGGVFFPTPDTNSSYNAMLVTLSRRFAQGFQFNANYRWSKSIDVVSNEAPTAQTNPTYPLDVRQEVGPSDYDVRHNFVMSALWDLPFFNHRRDLAGSILGGWHLDTIITWHTGFPWTPLVGNCISTRGASICPVRPVAYSGGAGTSSSNSAFITGSNFPGGGAKFFSTAAPVGFQLPGVGRNSFRGPHYRDVDLSIAKRFGLSSLLNEGASFEIKANFFNVFNLLNLQPFGFNTSSTVVTDANFGRAGGALSGRVVEVQARFSF